MDQSYSLSDLLDTRAALTTLDLAGYTGRSLNFSGREQPERMALGAAARDVLRRVLGQSASLIAIGSLAGVLLALGLSRARSIFLFGVSPFDPLTVGGVVLVLGAAAPAAGYRPASRATRVDPLTSLRTE